MSNTAAETPLLDLLKSVPADVRVIYETSPISSVSIPVGVLAKRAADALTAQAAEIEALKRWQSTHAPRIEALEGLLHAAQIEAHAGREAIATLSSEREANALLTSEIEALRADAEPLRGKQTVAIDEAVAADRERMLAALERHDWRPSNIWRYYYPSATGDWVDLRELRKLLGCPSAMQSGKAVTP